MFVAEDVVGDADEPRYADRARHYVDIGWGDAAKHRQLASTDTGVTTRITLPRGTFLRAGAVIFDDGEQVVVVRRPPEPAIAVEFAANVGAIRQLVLLGYVLGNQHAPIEIDDDGLTAPLFTSADAAESMLADMGVIGEVAAVALAADGWSRTSAEDHAGHRH
ncbi:MAG: ureE2 [Mycobacterium sp.]|nr:ureE2 [Mycobacterium sp.]